MNRITPLLIGTGLMAFAGLSTRASAAGGNPVPQQAPQANPQPKSGKLLAQPAPGGIELHNDSARSNVGIEITGLKPFILKPGEIKVVQPRAQGANPAMLKVSLRLGKDSLPLHAGAFGPAGGKWKVEVPVEPAPRR